MDFKAVEDPRGSLRSPLQVPMAIESCTIHFEGSVQGVGFRGTTASIMTRYSIKGYVMNLRDGRVRLLAQGERSTVSMAIQSLRQRFLRNITGSTETWSGATEIFTDFSIRKDCP
jgi:acylphosphatase